MARPATSRGRTPSSRFVSGPPSCGILSCQCVRCYAPARLRAPILDAITFSAIGSHRSLAAGKLSVAWKTLGESRESPDMARAALPFHREGECWSAPLHGEGHQSHGTLTIRRSFDREPPLPAGSPATPSLPCAHRDVASLDRRRRRTPARPAATAPSRQSVRR